VELAILNDQVEKLGVKTLEPHEVLINDWFERPKKTEPTIPMKSALGIATTILLDETASGALGFIRCNSADMQNQNLTFVVSGCNGQGGGSAVTPDNFEHAITTAAVRLLPKHTWYNDRDQFTIPTLDPILNRDACSQNFIDGCLMWLLFSGPNQTSSMKDVVYNDKIWQLRNQFFPFEPSGMLNWDIRNTNMYTQLRSAKSTYVADQVKDTLARLDDSPIAKATSELFKTAQSVYQLYFREYNNLDIKKWKLDYWDIGWYQVHNSLKDKGKGILELDKVKTASEELRQLLLPLVYNYGFLEPEVVFD